MLRIRKIKERYIRAGRGLSFLLLSFLAFEMGGAQKLAYRGKQTDKPETGRDVKKFFPAFGSVVPRRAEEKKPLGESEVPPWLPWRRGGESHPREYQKR